MYPSGTIQKFKGGNVITASQRLSWIFNAADELNLEGTEIVVSGAGTNVMTRVTGPTDDHNQLIFTASAADTTILEGSYLYLVAEHNTDVLSIKGCIRTSGGTIAVTYGNV